MESKSDSIPPIHSSTTNYCNIESEGINGCHQNVESEDVVYAKRLLSQENRTNVDFSHGEEETDRLLVQESQQPLEIFFTHRDNNLRLPKSDVKEMLKTKLRKQKKWTKESLGNVVNSEEEDELLFEVEEGVFTDLGSEAGEKRPFIRRERFGQHKSKFENKTWRIKHFMSCLVAFALFILLLLTWKLLMEKTNPRPSSTMRSNGTALFAPTTILVSLDGFRPDFLKRGITPRLNAMIDEGFSPAYMLPSFPSVTFPNHYTLVTGLHPESHGIVSNVFWDDELQEEFYYTKPEAMNTKWWGGEPIWVTAEKQGVRTAVHMWPGGEAHIMGVDPFYLDKFKYNTTMREKSARVLELLDKGGYHDGIDEDPRPQLIATYVPHVDIDGHYYGPNTTEIRNTISVADQMLNEIYIGLEQRNLTNIVNIIVVSDHGMATTDINRMIQLEDLLDLNNIDHIDGWPLTGLHLKEGVDVDELFQELSHKAVSNPNFEVYLKDKNMPKRYHFANNKRIAPLWIIPSTGWAIVTKKEFDIRESKLKGLQYHPRGLHGYDNEHPLMYSIFIARGPAFPHIPTNRIKPFQNTEVYNIICHTLGLIPASNNGTLQLPLRPIDSQEPDITLDIPKDMKDSSSTSKSPEEEIGNIIATSLPFVDVAPSDTASLEKTPAATASSTGSKSSLIVYPDYSWITDKESELLAWMEEKADQLKVWMNRWHEIK